MADETNTTETDNGAEVQSEAAPEKKKRTRKPKAAPTGVDVPKGESETVLHGKAVVGSGPVVWRGYIAKNPLFFANKPLEFHGSANEAEAKEQFKRVAGIRSTTGEIVVEKVGVVVEPEQEE